MRKGPLGEKDTDGLEEYYPQREGLCGLQQQRGHLGPSKGRAESWKTLRRDLVERP